VVLGFLRNALPYRYYGEFEMRQGRFKDARRILFMGARAVSESPDGGSGESSDAAELYNTWAICEWHLNNLPRAEVLFDHALRLVTAGEEGAALRSYILYAIARLELQRGEHHLAQHCLCLCLKEDAMPGGNARVWSLWSQLAKEMGDGYLADQCEGQVQLAEKKLVEAEFASATTMTKADMAKMMRKDPWHHKVFDMDSTDSKIPSFSTLSLPD
jgi:tetratricopeptide (TPR) repeat protein